MIFKKLANNNSIQVTVTSTATTLQSLIQTVDATQTLEADLDITWLNPESDIRWSVYNTPTTTKGMKLPWSATMVVTWTHPKDIYLIASTNTACNIQIGRSAMI